MNLICAYIVISFMYLFLHSIDLDSVFQHITIPKIVSDYNECNYSGII